MEEKREQPVVYSQTLKAGKRTYFFDIKKTSNGEYYLSLTESKRFFDKNDGNFYFKKRSLFLYKENMQEFRNLFNDVINFVEEKQGIEPYKSDREEANDYSNDDNSN